jgi:hypothetical protein
VKRRSAGECMPACFVASIFVNKALLFFVGISLK